MAKVVKIVSFVAAVALAIPSGGTSLLATALGVSSLAATAIVAGLAIGSSLLAKRPTAPRTSPASLDRLNASIDPRAPRKMILGHTAMATDIRDQEYTDDQTYLHRFIVVAAHKVQAIDEIWFDDKMAWSSGGGVTSDFSGYLTVATRTEGNSGNAINISARMGTTRRFTGLAYIHLKFKLTGNSKKAESPFSSSIPTRLTIRGKGALVYDPRLDSTVDGGSGSHRANDQSTWSWDDDAARNPALQLLWYLLGWRIENPGTSEMILSVGKGIPPERIDLASFAVAANICDESVSLAGGGSEPRYRSDGIFSEADSPSTVIDALKATMNADLDDVGGKLRLTVFVNDLATPTASFDQHAMIDGFKWTPTPALDESFNIVRGSYTDPSDNALYQPVDYPQQEYASADGIDRIETLDLPLVQSPYQAQRLARLRLNRIRYGGGEFSTVLDVTGWRVAKNCVVEVTLPALGWTDKLFRVAEMEHRDDGRCPIILRPESADIYDWDEDESDPIDPVAGTVYDPALNPIVQGIDEVSGAASASSTTIEITADTQTTAAVSLSLDAGASKAILCQIKVDALGGSSTQKARIEWRVAGGTFATLGSEATDTGGAGDTVFPIAAETLTNSGGSALLYEVRGVVTRTGSTGTRDASQSFLRA